MHAMPEGLNGIKLDLNKFDMTRRFHFLSFLEIHGAVEIFKIERFGKFKTGVTQWSVFGKYKSTDMIV